MLDLREPLSRFMDGMAGQPLVEQWRLEDGRFWYEVRIETEQDRRDFAEMEWLKYKYNVLNRMA